MAGHNTLGLRPAPPIVPVARTQLPLRADPFDEEIRTDIQRERGFTIPSGKR